MGGSKAAEDRAKASAPSSARTLRRLLPLLVTLKVAVP